MRSIASDVRPPWGRTVGAFYPQVTLAALAHPRLSMVGPLRGPRRMEVKREKIEVKNEDSARGASEKRKDRSEKQSLRK